MPERQPLGEDTVHIGGPAFVANGGVIEMGGPAQGPVGVNSEGSRAWGFTYDRDPATPGVGGLQVHPIVPEINYSAIYPDNGGETDWKGDLGKDGHDGF